MEGMKLDTLSSDPVLGNETYREAATGRMTLASPIRKDSQDTEHPE